MRLQTSIWEVVSKQDQFKILKKAFLLQLISMPLKEIRAA